MAGSLARRGALMLLAGAVGASLAMTAPARAADDGYANVFSSLFGAVGLTKPDVPPPIAYRERPPLVLPPQPGLPKPATAGTHAAAWPQDPDVLARRKEAEDAATPRAPTRDDGSIVPAAELAKERGPNQPLQPGDCGMVNNGRNCLLLSPDELKREGDAFSAADPSGKNSIALGAEPPRVFLTQPPKGYLKPNRVVKATTEAPKPIDNGDPYAFLKPAPKTDE